MTTTHHPVTALCSDADRALLDAAPAIVDRLHTMFSARSLDATPAKLTARIGVDTSYSTPEIALFLDADDPEGVYGYEAQVRVTGSINGSQLWVAPTRGMECVDDPEGAAALAFGMLISMLPDMDEL